MDTYDLSLKPNSGFSIYFQFNRFTRLNFYSRVRMQIYTAAVLCKSFYDPNQFEVVVTLERAAENFPARRLFA